ncbi:hypothetical protein OSB04_022238 [Centaurea solstitialis]|uniref:Uncharacterized protein n=1 Tax=Centaurea solstitialis TaxID=347529 RepID=A0AA38WEY8_9ASTR|nr:hypothetical protein OSB04_022238 [Centaurea solstitialis]
MDTKKRKLQTTTMADIFVLPFTGHGHLFPAMELCKNLSSHNYNLTLLIPSHVSSSIPSTFTQHSSLIHVVEISVPESEKTEAPAPRGHGHPLQDQNRQLGEGIKAYLSARSGARPACVVIDIMMSWSKDIFVNHRIPVASFFTSGAIASAVDYGKWKANVGDMKPGETRLIPGLPEEMAVAFSDLIKGRRGRPNRPTDGNNTGPVLPNRTGSGPPGGMRPRGGPPQPGQKPRWVDEVDGSVALLFNTCNDLERPFINYIAEGIKIPVWGVGPLLPEKYWKSAGSILHDHEMRSNHKSNYTEDDVIQWLESKPSGSVIYISFGSEVGPSIEEYQELAKSLEESDHPFIWVIQPGSGKSNMPRSFQGAGRTDPDSEEEEGYYPEGLEAKVGNRGLIITGWAPQLMILSHPSTGAFLSHCGWNSTVEAIGRGVPILAWPIGIDQFDNAKLVAKHLKIGHMITGGVDEKGVAGKFKKDDILAGIEKIMGDEKVRNEAKEFGEGFGSGFPVSSVNGLGAFTKDELGAESTENKASNYKLQTMADIFVLPFLGQGHLLPAMELCKNLSSHNYNLTLIIPSHLSSSIPSTFTQHSSLIHVVEISVSSAPPADEPGSGIGNPLHDQNIQMGEGIKSFLSTTSGSARPACVVIDVMMSWSKDIFVNRHIPVVSFFTSGAITSAMDYGKWKANVGDMKPGETRVIPGLPTELAVAFADLNRGPRGGRGRGRPERPNRPTDGTTGPPKRMRSGPPSGFSRRGPPTPGQKPRWLDEVDGSVALLINTCDHLERLFIDYIAEETKLPVWGIGPLLPEQFWKSAGSILHDHEMRSDHKSNYTEDEVIQWLESKPYGSVIYISFGSEVGPSIEEYQELAKSLEESKHLFIWVIQPGSGKTGVPKSFLGGAHTDNESEEEEGYYPEGLDAKVGKRGLIITGWAPQLLILSHPSTGGFLSHCGWNSTVEAIGRGVPILAWPIRGDQFDNAKLLAKHLKTGNLISSGANEEGRPGKLKKDDIAAGVERLMGDDEVRNQAKELGKEFESGFPVSSVNGLGAFVEFISSKAT